MHGERSLSELMKSLLFAVSSTDPLIYFLMATLVPCKKYSQIRGDVKLDPKLFDPQSWTTVHWKGVDVTGKLTTDNTEKIRI